MEICKSHKECFTKVCSLCEDYVPLSAHAMLDEVLERVDKWLMSNSNVEVGKIVLMKEEVRKHFV